MTSRIQAIGAAVLAPLCLAGCGEDLIATMHGRSSAESAAAPEPPAQPGKGAGFTIDTPLRDLAKNPEAKAVVDRYAPGVTDGPHAAMAGGYSLRQIRAQMPDLITEAELEQMSIELAAIQA